MFYFPDVKSEKLFKHFCLPLPKKLIPFLVERGLNVMVLPEDGEKSEALMYGLLRVKREPIPYVGVLPHLCSHYQPSLSTIVLPTKNLRKATHNVVIHELGHALDFLYFRSGRLVSDVASVVNCIRSVPPLDSHCEEQDTAKNNNLEQFASSFEAFFNEYAPPSRKSEFYHTIDELDYRFVELMRKNFIDPFME